MSTPYLLAVILNLVTIFLIYYGLFGVLKLLYRKGAVCLVAFLIFLSPFVYILTHIGSLLELMWVFLLTPFYAVFILMLLFTDWLLLYYGIAYAVLALLYYLFLKRKGAGRPLQENEDSEANSKLPGSSGKWFFVKRMGKYASLVLAIILATALVGTVRESVRDPTFREASEFIVSDQTNLNHYAKGSYTCDNFAMDFKNNAFNAGYRCGYVLAYFHGVVHALDCFNTTDRGLIFVEPQTDNVITLTAGDPYWDRAIYEPPDYNDTLLGYRIFW